MRYKFNQQAAIWTFVAVIIVFKIATLVTKFENNQREMPLIGSLIYGILGLFASIITGLIVRVKKKNYNLNENEKEKENERRLKNGKKN